MLDYLISRTVHAAHLLEQACHSQEDWEIVLGHAIAPAQRIISDESIVIEAMFPASCWVLSPEMIAELRCGGELADARPVIVPDDEVPFAVQWRFEVREPVVASVR